LEKDFAYVADYDNNTSTARFVEDPNRPPYGPFSWDKSYPYTIQQYQFKSKHKPFICFEPKNTMFIKHNGLKSYHRAGGCNHFPVGQARCDGRTTRMADRPSHCSGFPISDPVIHEEGDRYYWSGFYGMNDMELNHLVQLGRSWIYAPELSITSSETVSNGYDRSRRCYRFQNRSDKPIDLEFTIHGSKNSPVMNPAFHIKNWNAESARVLVNGKEFRKCEFGFIHQLGGTDLVVFMWMETNSKIQINIIPE
jgi:hypothetical protein